MILHNILNPSILITWKCIFASWCADTGNRTTSSGVIVINELVAELLFYSLTTLIFISILDDSFFMVSWFLLFMIFYVLGVYELSWYLDCFLLGHFTTDIFLTLVIDWFDFSPHLRGNFITRKNLISYSDVKKVVTWLKVDRRVLLIINWDDVSVKFDLSYIHDGNFPYSFLSELSLIMNKIK